MSIWFVKKDLFQYITNCKCLFLTEATECDPSKLNFNGGYNCSGNQETLSCSLFCPDGIQFSKQPEPYYTCSYSNGRFESKFAMPQCLLEQGMVMTKGKRHYSSINTFSDVDLKSFNWYSIIQGNPVGRKYTKEINILLLCYIFIDRNFTYANTMEG